jgi:nitroreductase
MLTGVTPQIESILAAGNHVFSNGNCQPWRFLVKDTNIEIHIDPEKDQSPYNSGNRMSYFTVGAMIENIAISASSLGMSANVKHFPSTDPNYVALLELQEHAGKDPDPLAPEILLRVTNRKKFLPLKMADKEKDNLLNIAQNSAAKIYLADDRTQINQLAEAAALDDEMIFSNEAVHSFFFSHINWTDDEDKTKMTGLHKKTLELSPYMLVLLYMLQNWQFAQLLAQAGLHKFMANQNKTIYAAAAAIGAITIPNDEPQAFLEAGRIFERLWLTATKIGLSMQPLNGLPYLKLFVDSRTDQTFSPQQIERIDTGYKMAQRALGVESQRLVCMFRIGGGSPSSGHTTRRDLDKIVTST